MTMTDTDVAARLDALVAQLERLGIPLDAPQPLAAGALPPHVASGELITSAWGNAVVDALQLYNETRPYASATFSGAVANAGVNNQLAFVNPTNVVNPDGVISIGNSALIIPTKWPGLWLVTVTFRFGPYGTSPRQCSGWVDRAGTRFGSTGTRTDAAMTTQTATSALIPCTAGTGLALWAFNENPGGINVAFDITCTWVGRSPV